MSAHLKRASITSLAAPTYLPADGPCLSFGSHPISTHLNSTEDHKLTKEDALHSSSTPKLRRSFRRSGASHLLFTMIEDAYCDLFRFSLVAVLGKRPDLERNFLLQSIGPLVLHPGREWGNFRRNLALGSRYRSLPLIRPTQESENEQILRFQSLTWP